MNENDGGIAKQEKRKEPGFGGKKGSCDVGIPAKEGEYTAQQYKISIQKKVIFQNKKHYPCPTRRITSNTHYPMLKNKQLNTIKYYLALNRKKFYSTLSKKTKATIVFWA